MTPQEIDELRVGNARELDRMNIAAGSLVSALLSELARKGRNTFIRLHDPAPGGHTVSYEFVEGDPTLVGRAARALGFRAVTDSQLEVNSG